MTQPDLTPLQPSVQDVADLVRVRVVHEGGETVAVNTFDTTTWPTAVDVTRLIVQATNFIYPQVPGSVSGTHAPAVTHLCALYAAILVESSYFREQLTDDMVRTYWEMLQAGIKGIGDTLSTDETASRDVDTVIMRSVMTDPWEMQMWLEMPRPWPFPESV